MQSISGKVIWITGASSGIGEALVKAFAVQGCKVVLTARRENELLRVQKKPDYRMKPASFFHLIFIMPKILPNRP